MTDQKSRPAFMRTLSVMALGVLAVFAGIVVAEESGWIGSDPARRAVSALMGVLLALCGNYLPKLTAAATANSVHLAKADRAAGWLLIVTGVCFALIWLIAPLGWARGASALIGLGGGLVALCAWAFAARRAEGGSARLAAFSFSSAARLGVAMIVGGLFATFGLFEVDRRWGDEAAQWTSLAVVMVLVFVAASPFVRAASRRG